MKWLIVTPSIRTPKNLNTNIGDEFICLGTVKVIKQADPDAIIEFLRKENPEDLARERPFDKAVVAGPAQFWSINDHTCCDIWWWPHIYRSWLARDKNKLITFGVGNMIHNDGLVDFDLYCQSIKEVIDKSWALTVRSPLINHPKVIDTICPSAFNLMNIRPSGFLRTCNLSPFGGHLGYLIQDGLDWSKGHDRIVSDKLQDLGFDFIAHTAEDAAYAKALGWPDERIFMFGSALEYLHIYTSAVAYIGNRVHGGAICSALGLPTLVMTHDSRRELIYRLGGTAVLPMQVTPQYIEDWMLGKVKRRIITRWDIREEFDKMVLLMQQFMRA